MSSQKFTPAFLAPLPPPTTSSLPRALPPLRSPSRARRPSHLHTVLSAAPAGHGTGTESATPAAAPPDPPPRSLFDRLRATMALAKSPGFLKTYGVAAMLAYGFIDLFSYGGCLAAAIYIYAGKEGIRALTWKAAPAIWVIMYGLNSVLRPLRLVGTVALAPLVNEKVVQPLKSWWARRRKHAESCACDTCAVQKKDEEVRGGGDYI